MPVQRAEIVELFRSTAHRFEGRPGPELPAAGGPGGVGSLEIRAGLGVVGDRYFNRPAHRDASVTVMAAESLAPWPGAGLAQTRRTVLLRGVDVDALPAGTVLGLDSGDGEVRLRVGRRANPCAWMDYTLGPGAWRALRGRGGMRCAPLTDGTLRVGPVDVTVTRPSVGAART